MNLLSFSSKVVYGHVGHSAARLLLERLGHTVWAVDTVVFSNHPGHGRYTGRVTPAAEIHMLADGLEDLGVLADCGAVFSGYLGSAANGAAVLEAVHRVKAVNPNALYALDPVMGDRDGGLFVTPDLPPFFAEAALPLADLAFPNAFELERLAGLEVRDLRSALDAADVLRGRGVKLVVTTGVEGSGNVATLAVSGEEAWSVETPRLPCRAHGAGDVLAALFLGHFCGGQAVPPALERAVAGVYALLEKTLEAEELTLIAAQDQAVRPSRSWPARRLR